LTAAAGANSGDTGRGGSVADAMEASDNEADDDDDDDDDDDEDDACCC
jgi:hypothetical protein